MQADIKKVTPADQRILYLTNDMIDKHYSTPYTQVINIPDLRNYSFKKVSLITASFPNSFLTIQGNNTNEKLELDLIYNEEINSNIIPYKTNLNIYFDEGFFDDDKTLYAHFTEKLLGIRGYQINGLNEHPEFNDTPLIKLDTDQKSLFNLETVNGNTRCKFSGLIFCYKHIIPDQGPEYSIKLDYFHLQLLNLFYKFVGGKYSNEDVQVIFTSESNDAEGYCKFSITFPYRPNIIWISTIQVRLNIVDSAEDSNVLINIPIRDFTQSYISFSNTQITQTAKKVCATVGRRIEVQLTNQDGYEIKFNDLGCNLDILLF